MGQLKGQGFAFSLEDDRVIPHDAPPSVCRVIT